MSRRDSETRLSAMAELVQRPFEFDFLQAATLLQVQGGGEVSVGLVGFDNPPTEERIQFRAAPTFRNNASQISEITSRDDKYEITVSFLGLVGVNGVLPHHYTQTVIHRVKQHDYAMRDFFDLFHHRILSMFFRASIKYRLPYRFLFNRMSSQSNDDAITQSLRCLVGLGETQSKHKLNVKDFTVLRYGGHFADAVSTAHSLQRIVQDFTGKPAEVLQFQFEWLYIDASEQTLICGSANDRLGISTVAGDRIPTYHNRFRIRLGPVSWADFKQLLPGGDRFDQLADLVRLYVGLDLDFDLQVAVRGVPELELDPKDPPQLGRTTWICSEPLTGTVDDAVFEMGSF